MRNKLQLLIMTFMISLVMISCGGGGSDSYPELEGTWYGVWEENLSGNVYTVEITFNNKGAIIRILENGSDTNLKGSATKDSDQVYIVSLNDGSDGKILMDTGVSHFTYFDNFTFVGVFQKGATVLPAYQLPDYEGTWSGHSVQVDADMDIVDEADTVMTVDSNLDVIGTTVGGAFSGSILDWVDETRGAAAGENTAGDVFFHIFLSVDKTFITTYSCPNIDPDLYDFYECEFGGWAKQ